MVVNLATGVTTTDAAAAVELLEGTAAEGVVDSTLSQGTATITIEGRNHTSGAWKVLATLTNEAVAIVALTRYMRVKCSAIAGDAVVRVDLRTPGIFRTLQMEQ